MAILRFELEIDSEVYPELYARLASLSRTPARAEKLRQLAATGLLWEMARLHGPALADLLADLGGDLPTVPSPGGEGKGRAPGPTASGRDGTVDDGVQGPIPTARVLDHPEASLRPAAAAARTAAAESGAAPSATTFVDLALDVAPAAAAVAPEVPVLLDEVPPSLLHEVPAVTMAMVVPIRSDPPSPASDDDEHHEANEPRESTVRRTASRERLKRMRDRGLFQNG